MYSKELKALIETKAYELWENEGWLDGHDLEHWLRAETEVLSHPANKTVLVQQDEQDPEEKQSTTDAEAA